MSFLSIVMLVLTALIILSLLFVFFKAVILLLPVAIIAIAIIWLVYWIAGKRNKNNISTSGPSFTWPNSGNPTTTSTRRKARNVTTKDVDN